MPLHAQKCVSLSSVHMVQLLNVFKDLYRHPTSTHWIVSSPPSRNSSLKGRPVGRQPFQRFMTISGSMLQLY